MGRMTSYDRYGRIMSDFDKSAYDPCWYHDGQPQTTAFVAPNEGVKLAANLRRLEEDNAKLRELCGELLRMAESNDPDFLHWPEIHDELRKLVVKIVKL